MNALTVRRGGRRGTAFRVVAPVVLFALAMQAVLGTEPDAFAWAAASAAVVLLTLAYCFRPGLFERFPLSTIIVIGFDAVTLAIPLVAQSLCGRSLLFNLSAPDQTFLWIFFSHAVLVGTHAGYTTLPLLSQPGRFVARRVFAPLTVFRTPTPSQLWVLGAVGLFATIYVLVSNVATIEYGDVGGKAATGLLFFSVFPFLIPFRKMFRGDGSRPTLASLPALIAYFALVLLIAIATNKRTQFAFIGLTLVVMLLMLSSMGRLRLSSRAKIITLAVIVISTPIFSFLENVTTAMEMVRAAKGSVSGAGYIQATLDQLSDTTAIERWRKDNEGQDDSGANYNEDYIPILLINRLIYLKFTDLTMNDRRFEGDSQNALLKQDFTSRSLAQLPTPVAQTFGIFIDKRALEYSAGDLYDSFASGELGDSFLTGSSITYSRDVLGRYWLPVMAVIFLLIFNLFDSLTLWTQGRTIISPCAIVFFYRIFMHGAIGDSLDNLTGDPFRDLFQTVALYIVIMFVVRALLSALLPTGGAVAGARTLAR